MARWHLCNVLRSGKDARQLWQFQIANRKCTLQKEESKLPQEPLPSRLFAKDWEDLVRPRLNVAWIPATHVFLKVVSLPTADATETHSMLELQLEKLSPLPPAQIVWSYEVLSQSGSAMQTALLIVVPRQQVELYLGELESFGYYCDRLELPFLDQLRNPAYQEDGIWIYPGWGANRNTCLVAWWQEGVLRHLNLIHLPEDAARGAVFQGQISQMIWTAELEGWAKPEPRYHLVAGPELVEVWQPLFDPDQPVQMQPPTPLSELATHTARRAAMDSVRTNLLPPEYSARYKQRLVDRLWMRALVSMAMLYLIGVAIYVGWTEVAKWKLARIQKQVAGISQTYTNTLRFKEQVRVMQNQMALQFAALDCWKALSDHLPTELTLDMFNFEKGRRVVFHGTVASESVERVTDFYEKLKDATMDNQRLFKVVEPPRINPRPPNMMAWNFTCELERSEAD